MANKRNSTRHRRRLRVQLEPGGTLFTADVSAGGLCIHSARPLPPGSPVRGRLTLSGEDFGFEGVVAWVRQGEPRLGLQGRIGVRFTQVPDTLVARVAPEQTGTS